MLLHHRLEVGQSGEVVLDASREVDVVYAWEVDGRVGLYGPCAVVVVVCALETWRRRG